MVTALQGRETYEWRDFVGSLSQLAMNTAAKLGLDVLVIASAGRYGLIGGTHRGFQRP